MTCISRSVTVDVDVDVDMRDFEDEELIDEMRDRGLTNLISQEIEDAILYWKRGDYQESLTRIEMAYPELYGITRLRKE